MTAYAALLRGVNLGSVNRVSMPALVAACERAGLTGVSTYVQSGNAVFHSSAPQAKLAGLLEGVLEADLGVGVRVLVRSAAELAVVVAASPYAAAEPDPRLLHVTFLDVPPEPARAAALKARAEPPEELAVVGREVYLHLPGGYGRSKLSNQLVEKQLGVAATTRNWNTVMTLAQMTSSSGRLIRLG